MAVLEPKFARPPDLGRPPLEPQVSRNLNLLSRTYGKILDFSFMGDRTENGHEMALESVSRVNVG